MLLRLRRDGLRHRGDLGALVLDRCGEVGAVPGRIVAPVGLSRSATAGSAAIARTSAAMRSFRLSGMSRQP